MGNIVFATPELSDAATITGGPVSASGSLAKLQDMQPSIPCLLTDLTQTFLIVDLLSSQQIGLVWLGYTNVTSSATWRIRATDTLANLTSSPSYDSGTVSMLVGTASTWTRPHALKWFGASPKTFRYWRIDIVDTTNPAGVLSIGRLYMSRGFQPSRSVKYGVNVGYVETARRTASLGGNVFPRISARHQTADITLEYLTQTEMLGSIAPIQRQRGVSQDILICLDPDEPTYIMDCTVYGLLKDAAQYSNVTFKKYNISLSIEEMP